MALAETARLIASLELKDNFSKPIGSAERSLGSFDKHLGSTSTRAYKAGTQIGTGIKTGAVLAAGAIGFLAANVAVGLKSLQELETVTTQTNAVLKSTKGAAGQTAESIRNLAEKYEGLNATIDDKVIQSAENVLLTFTAVRKQAFEPAIQAALDMSTALGTDLQGSVIQIGKALQDPIKGITALRRVGVNFSTDQIKVIKKLVETGDVLGAQKVILAELNTEFGGSFLAGGSTTAGKVAKFRDAIEDLQKVLATALLPVIGKVTDALTKFLADPRVNRAVADLGKNIAGLFSDANLARGADFLKGAFETAKTAAPIVAAAAKASFTFIQAAVSLFKQLPAPLQGLLVGGFALNKLTGGLVTNITGGLIDLIGKSRGATPGNPVFTKEVGLPTAGGASGIVGKSTTTLGKVTDIVSKVFIVGAVAGLFADLVKTVIDIRNQSAEQGKTIATSVANEINGGASLADLQRGLAAVDAGILEISNNPLNVLLAGDALDTLKASHLAYLKQIELLKQNLTTPDGKPPIGAPPAPGKRLPGDGSDARGMGGQLAHTITSASREAASKIKDDIRGLGALLSKARSAEFLKLAAALAHPKTPAELKRAADGITKLITQGRGSAQSTVNVLKSLRSQLKNTHDPKLASALRADIRKVEARLPGRQFAAQELATAKNILGSNKTGTQKITELKAVEQALKDRGLPHAASVIHQKIVAAQRLTTSAANKTAAEVRRKKLAVTVNNAITVPVSVTGRSVATTIRKSSRFGVQVD